MLYNLN